jgi:hypothetical protein
VPPHALQAADAKTRLYVNVVMCEGASSRLNGGLMLRLHGFRERHASGESAAGAAAAPGAQTGSAATQAAWPAAAGAL